MAPRTGHRDRWVQLAGSCAALGLGAALIFAIPALVGVSWSAIGADLARVPLTGLAGLGALWLVGLLVHAPVLKAAMPGLTSRQALTLNLSGSAVSNVLPLGGPMGMGLGLAMARSWGFRNESYTSFLVCTNLWNMLGRFAVGTSVLAVAAVFGSTLPAGIGVVVLVASALVLVVIGATAASLWTDRASTAVGRRLDQLVVRVRPTADPSACAAWLVASRTELLVGLRTSWKRMASGVLVYLVLQATLLWACLLASGIAPPIGIVAIAFAVERMISLAPITPGAAGFAEVGTIAALQAFGVDPASAAAGVLLYRVFMFALDIPVGGVLAIGWLHQQRRTSSDQVPAPLAPTAAEAYAST